MYNNFRHLMRQKIEKKYKYYKVNDIIKIKKIYILQ